MTSSKFHSIQRIVAAGSTLLAGFALFTGCTSSGDDTSDDSSAAATAGRSGTTPAGAGGALYPDLGEGGEAGQPSQPSGGFGGTSGALGGLGGGSGTAAGGNGGASTGGGGSGGVAGGGTAGMSASGSSGAASTTCGNGIVDAGEACDASSSMGGTGGTGGGTADPTCSNTCTKVSNAACVACEFEGVATCTDFLFNCQGPGGSFTAAQQTQCNSVLTCIQSSNCFDGTGSLGGACYCGTLSLSDCQAAPFDLSKPGAPNGACATVIQAGLPGLSANAAVLGSLTAAAKPAGAAMQLLNCQKTADGAACLGACGFTAGGPAFP